MGEQKGKEPKEKRRRKAKRARYDEMGFSQGW